MKQQNKSKKIFRKRQLPITLSTKENERLTKARAERKSSLLREIARNIYPEVRI